MMRDFAARLISGVAAVLERFSVWLRSSKRAPRLPIGVGDQFAQKRFIEENGVFLQEYPRLHELCGKVFLRTVAQPDEKEVQRLLALPADDPAVVAFEDKQTANRLIFYLGRMAVDDFGEVLTLAGNGRGFGAYKILRGMYERVVTALYLAKNPSEARPFAEASAITKLNYLNRTFAASPESRAEFSDEFMATIERDAAAAQAKRKQSICSKCGQPVTQEAWTRVSLDVMAKAAQLGLERFYPQFYLEGTAQSHANVFGIERRLVGRDGGFAYKEISEKEAQFAVHLSHHLIVLLLSMQNAYFGLGLENEVRQRIDGFLSVWGSEPADSLPQEQS